MNINMISIYFPATTGMFNLCTSFNGTLKDDAANFMQLVIGRNLRETISQYHWVNTTDFCGIMVNQSIGTPLERLIYHDSR